MPFCADFCTPVNLRSDVLRHSRLVAVRKHCSLQHSLVWLYCTLSRLIHLRAEDTETRPQNDHFPGVKGIQGEILCRLSSVSVFHWAKFICDFCVLSRFFICDFCVSLGRGWRYLTKLAQNFSNIFQLIISFLLALCRKIMAQRVDLVKGIPLIPI